jgi:hypothetical protein
MSVMFSRSAAVLLLTVLVGFGTTPFRTSAHAGDRQPAASDQSQADQTQAPQTVPSDQTPAPPATRSQTKTGLESSLSRLLAELGKACTDPKLLAALGKGCRAGLATNPINLFIADAIVHQVEESLGVGSPPDFGEAGAAPKITAPTSPQQAAAGNTPLDLGNNAEPPDPPIRPAQINMTPAGTSARLIEARNIAPAGAATGDRPSRAVPVYRDAPPLLQGDPPGANKVEPNGPPAPTSAPKSTQFTKAPQTATDAQPATSNQSHGDQPQAPQAATQAPQAAAPPPELMGIDWGLILRNVENAQKAHSIFDRLYQDNIDLEAALHNPNLDEQTMRSLMSRYQNLLRDLGQIDIHHVSANESDVRVIVSLEASLYDNIVRLDRRLRELQPASEQGAGTPDPGRPRPASGSPLRAATGGLSANSFFTPFGTGDRPPQASIAPAGTGDRPSSANPASQGAQPAAQPGVQSERTQEQPSTNKVESHGTPAPASEVKPAQSRVTETEAPERRAVRHVEQGRSGAEIPRQSQGGGARLNTVIARPMIVERPAIPQRSEPAPAPVQRRR